MVMSDWFILSPVVMCHQKGVELQRVSIGHLLAGSIECRVGLLFPTLWLAGRVGGGAARGRRGGGNGTGGAVRR
jgi:hypothetical protein